MPNQSKAILQLHEILGAVVEDLAPKNKSLATEVQGSIWSKFTSLWTKLLGTVGKNKGWWKQIDPAIKAYTNMRSQIKLRMKHMAKSLGKKQMITAATDVSHQSPQEILKEVADHLEWQQQLRTAERYFRAVVKQLGIAVNHLDPEYKEYNQKNYLRKAEKILEEIRGDIQYIDGVFMEVLTTNVPEAYLKHLEFVYKHVCELQPSYWEEEKATAKLEAPQGFLSIYTTAIFKPKGDEDPMTGQALSKEICIHKLTTRFDLDLQNLNLSTIYGMDGTISMPAKAVDSGRAMYDWYVDQIGAKVTHWKTENRDKHLGVRIDPKVAGNKESYEKLELELEKKIKLMEEHKDTTSEQYKNTQALLLKVRNDIYSSKKDLAIKEIRAINKAKQNWEHSGSEDPNELVDAIMYGLDWYRLKPSKSTETQGRTKIVKILTPSTETNITFDVKSYKDLTFDVHARNLMPPGTQHQHIIAL